MDVLKSHAMMRPSRPPVQRSLSGLRRGVTDKLSSGIEGEGRDARTVIAMVSREVDLGMLDDVRH